MSLKPGTPKDCIIKEQIVEDICANLTLQFEVIGDGVVKLSIYKGEQMRDGLPSEILPFGNRDIIFENGIEAGGGTNLAGKCKPAWPTNPEDL